MWRFVHKHARTRRKPACKQQNVYGYNSCMRVCAQNFMIFFYGHPYLLSLINIQLYVTLYNLEHEILGFSACIIA